MLTPKCCTGSALPSASSVPVASDETMVNEPSSSRSQRRMDRETRGREPRMRSQPGGAISTVSTCLYDRDVGNPRVFDDFRGVGSSS